MAANFSDEMKALLVHFLYSLLLVWSVSWSGSVYSLKCSKDVNQPAAKANIRVWSKFKSADMSAVDQLHRQDSRNQGSSSSSGTNYLSASSSESESSQESISRPSALGIRAKPDGLNGVHYGYMLANLERQVTEKDGRAAGPAQRHTRDDDANSGEPIDNSAALAETPHGSRRELYSIGKTALTGFLLALNTAAAMSIGGAIGGHIVAKSRRAKEFYKRRAMLKHCPKGAICYEKNGGLFVARQQEAGS